MQLSEALALAIEALRADAASARDGIAPDHESADRDQAASDELEHVLGSIRSGDDIADMIESRIEAAGGGSEGWNDLELRGDDQFLALSAVAELARIVQRMHRDGSASVVMRAETLNALCVDVL